MYHSGVVAQMWLHRVLHLKINLLGYTFCQFIPGDVEMAWNSVKFNGRLKFSSKFQQSKTAIDLFIHKFSAVRAARLLTYIVTSPFISLFLFASGSMISIKKPYFSSVCNQNFVFDFCPDSIQISLQ